MANNFKEIILSKFELLRKKETADKNPFKARAYAKVMSQICDLETVTSVEQVTSLPGVGAKIKAKIEEIFATGTLEAADRIPATTLAADQLAQVHGVGPVKAKKLIEAGILTIDDLRAASAADETLLHDCQKAGLKYFDSLQERIPRAEMTKHEAFLRTYLCPEWDITVVGSYRRGAANSGDIDVLITNNHNNHSNHSNTTITDTTMTDTTITKEIEEKFETMVLVFRAIGYIVPDGILALGGRKFMGICRLSKRSKPRRLDLMLTPRSEYPYAILYFTGSDKFNIGMRGRARELGYTMNEHTMKPLEDEDHVKIVPPMESEEDIFRFLNMEWTSPTNR